MDLPNLKDVLNPATIEEHLTEEEIQELVELLPGKDKSELRYAFDVKDLNGFTPFENFERKLKKGYYTSLREREDIIMEKLNQQKLK